MSLNAQRKRFADEYLIDLNATQAYKRAGYKGKGRSAENAASRLLGHVGVQQYIAERMKDREKRTEITQDRVLQELARIAFFDIRKLYNQDGSMKLPSELDDEAAAVLSGVDVTEEWAGTGQERMMIGHTKKAKIFDKGSALTLAMRHLGMLKDKVEHTGKDGESLVQPILNVSIGGK